MLDQFPIVLSLAYAVTKLNKWLCSWGTLNIVVQYSCLKVLLGYLLSVAILTADHQQFIYEYQHYLKCVVFMF